MGEMNGFNRLQTLIILIVVIVLLNVFYWSQWSREKYVVQYSIMQYNADNGEWTDAYLNQKAIVVASNYPDMIEKLYEMEQSRNTVMVIDSIRVDSFVILGD